MQTLQDVSGFTNTSARIGMFDASLLNILIKNTSFSQSSITNKLIVTILSEEKVDGQERIVTMIVAYTILCDSQVLSIENQKIRRRPIVEKGFEAILAALNPETIRDL